MFSIESSFSISADIGDFNNDRLLDIVIINDGTNSIGILFATDQGFRK